MKTLLVLSALASIAIAAPSIPEEGYTGTRYVPNWHTHVRYDTPEVVKRERKSTSELSIATNSHIGAPDTDLHHDAVTTPFTGRSISSKKPLIVKKKSGYRLYRDSEEEKAHADSQETCGRQVKVKLCDEDGKFKQMLRSSTNDVSKVHATADDMKLSIKMAKEAVETLQRDLLKMENKNPAMKMAHHSEADADLHEDIEVARQALEHIHTNFGDLETMSLHATASRDSEAMHDVHITMAKSEEEKMAQWKEAMENIQKNVEIARNIEDSFKSANNQESLLNIVTQPALKIEQKVEDISSHLLSNEEHHMRGAETTHMDMQTTANEHIEDGLTDKVITEHFTNTHARDGHELENDMDPSASEAVEMKAIDIKNHHTLRSENHEKPELKKNAEEIKENLELEHHDLKKSAEVDMENHVTDVHNTELHADVPTHSSSLIKTEPIVTVKEAEEQTQAKLDDSNVLFKTTENGAEDNKMPSTNAINTLASNMITEQQRNTEEIRTGSLGHHELLENTPENIEHLTDLHAKSVHNIDLGHVNKEEKLNEETGKAVEASDSEVENHHTLTFEAKPKDASLHLDAEEMHLHQMNNVMEQLENSMRAAESVDTLQDHHTHQKIDYNDSDHMTTLTDMKLAEPELLHHLSSMKSAEHHLHHNVPLMNTAEHHLHHHVPSIKSGEHHLHQHVPTMKSAESRLQHHVATMDLAENNIRRLDAVPTKGSWSSDNMRFSSKEATEDFHKKGYNGIDQNNMKTSHLAEHRYAPHNMEVTRDLHMSQHTHQHINTPSRFHQSQMHEMGGMNEGLFGSNFHPNMREAMDGSEHMYRWAPTHEYRNAYGPGLSGSIGSGSYGSGSIGSGSIGSGSIGSGSIGSGSIGSGISGGAVGVFPNANIGGCGIPLLLSCSPSVVSGSLAKGGQGSYGSGGSLGSYRSEDEFGFHNKRDVKKTSELRNTKVLRTPAILKQKTGTTLENQL